MNCLKCGRTVAEGELLCPACSGRGSHAEAEHKVQEYAHQKAHEPTTADPNTAIERLEKRIGRIRRWMLVFLIACMVLIGFILLQFVAIGYLRSQLSAADAALTEKSAAIAELQEELESTHELLSVVEEDLAIRDMIIDAYEQMTEIPADSLP